MDRDGDLWFVELVSALIQTPDAVDSPRPVEESLASIPWVEQVACYAPATWMAFPSPQP